MKPPHSAHPTDGPTVHVNRPSGGAVVGDTAPRTGQTGLDPAKDTHALGSVPITRADSYPRAGDTFCGFEVLNELGRGGMGRVYLAAQPSMASRRVVLKVGEYLSSECQKLARLQHPNVAPVYSFHQQGKLQAVCMPYRGPLTLAHLMARLQHENLPTLSGQALTTVIDDCRKSRAQSIGHSHPAADPAPGPVPGETAELPFARLRGLSFVDAVLTIARQIAEGLRFAHSEKIVHSDLKPANVLIADDGCPQLLDFGIAYDQSNPCTKGLVIGGTRPYSSPEQLGSLLHTAIEHDERADLYSLGVMLYQMTTGRLPFAPNYDSSDEAIDEDRRSRFVPPPSPRSLNPRVSPAVASVIGKCLAANSADRYQSAADLIEDLDRHLAGRPLRHAPNPSRWELATKWICRHRWLVAAGVALAVTGTAAGSFGVHSSRQRERLISAEAVNRADRFEQDVRRAQAALAVATADAAELEAAVQLGERALAGYQVQGAGRWWESGPAADLPPEQVAELRQRAGGLLLDLSRAAGTRATLVGAPADRGRWLARAADWNRRAEQAYPTAHRGVWTQRAWLDGKTTEAVAAAERAASIPLVTAVDFRTEGRELMEQGKWHEAGDRLARAVDLDPTDYWSQFNYGLSQYRLGRNREAAAAFDVCVSLDPTVPGAYFNRGLAHLRLHQFPKAEDDFTRVIAAKPDWADPYLNRSTVREGLRKYQEAADDLSKAIDLGYPPTAVLLTRSRVYARMGRDELAQQDLDAGMREPPTDERGWITRGLARMPPTASAGLQAYQNSLDDFDQALALNPRSATALQCKARVYSQARENRLAVATLSELLDYYPETLDALSGRAMLYSRLGERDKAHADAEAALKYGDAPPRTEYQLAGVYAMTSQTHPEDKREAFRHLASALRNGYGFELLDQDRELDPLRPDPEFSRVIDEAKRVVERRSKE